MPDADELVAAYQEAGGTTAVARQYGVPRHTATGWVRRLRRLGLLETPRR
jgi:transposase-like protein